MFGGLKSVGLNWSVFYHEGDVLVSSWGWTIKKRLCLTSDVFVCGFWRGTILSGRGVS